MKIHTQLNGKTWDRENKLLSFPPMTKNWRPAVNRQPEFPPGWHVKHILHLIFKTRNVLDHVVLFHVNIIFWNIYIYIYIYIKFATFLARIICAGSPSMDQVLQKYISMQNSQNTFSSYIPPFFIICWIFWRHIFHHIKHNFSSYFCVYLGQVPSDMISINPAVD